MTQKTTESGFTLIEVILFLAIASLMFMGVMVGVSGTINQQRYEDAVISLQDYLQGQYNLVDNVRNNRPDNRPCTVPSGVGTSGSQARGTSDCAVVGRFINSADGVEITSKPVYATGASYVTDGSEAALLDSLGLEKAPADLSTDDDDFKIYWGAEIYTNPSSVSTSKQFSMLILRLPTNGLMRTFTSTSNVTNLSTFWAGASTDLPLCLDPAGIDIGVSTLGVKVRADAASSAGVQRITSGEGTC